MRHFLCLSSVSFFVHFAWESVQCPVFFVHGSYDATWTGMATASLGDVLLTWGIFGAAAFGSRRWRWETDGWKVRQWVVLAVVAITLGVGIELHALATGRWSYQETMPLLPGLDVGIVPLVQLLVLPPACFQISARLLSETAEE